MKCSLDANDLADSVKWTPEQILLGWINYQLECGGHATRVSNFASDFKVISYKMEFFLIFFLFCILFTYNVVCYYYRIRQ